MEFSRPEDCSGSHSPGDCPNPGMEPRSPALQAGSLPAESLRRQTASYLCVLKIHFLPLAAFKISLFFFFCFQLFNNDHLYMQNSLVFLLLEVHVTSGIHGLMFFISFRKF